MVPARRQGLSGRPAVRVRGRFVADVGGRRGLVRRHRRSARLFEEGVMSYDAWIAAIAEILNCWAQEIAELPGIEDLYRGRLSPLEAADCIRLW